jgi:TnpA family transposase
MLMLRFGSKRRGFIIYTHKSDNYAPFYTQVISASAREATYVLDGLYHGTSLMPREHYTDSHGYTDVVFALTYLLGFRLALRMAKVPDLTLWYGKGYQVDFSELFDGRILPHTIAGQWEAMQRIATTIQSGRTRASQIIRKISAFSRKHPLFKAFRNLGRLVRTRHVLEIAGDKEYRRRILQGLNKGESKNSLAKDLRYARRGIIREKDPEMQLNVATSMNFAILCIALWNTIYMQRGIRLLKQEGYQINQEDLRFLSPFTYRHINLYGQFHFKSLPSPDSLSAEKEFEPL